MERFTLAAGAVDVWQIHLAITDEQIQCCRRLLSNDEVQRANRFRFEKDRAQFTAARSAMRTILSKYLGVAPQELAFSYSAYGKPELALPMWESGIRFNLSHSRDYGLLAVVHGLCVGVDIEFINHQLATDEISAGFFSPEEVRTLRGVPAHSRTDAFFSCWTRKEAYVKALGTGLCCPLDSFDVAFGPGVPAALLRVPAAPMEFSRWKIYDIAPPQGYAAAVVVEGEQHRLQQYEWKTARSERSSKTRMRSRSSSIDPGQSGCSAVRSSAAKDRYRGGRENHRTINVQ